VSAAATAAGWRPPRQAAALACPEAEVGRLGRRLAAELAARHDGMGCVVVADPTGPGRARELERAAAGVSATLGPAGTVAELPRSWRLASAIHRVTAASEGLRRADDHLSDILLAGGREVVDRIAERRLARFGDLTPKARRRMEETALAYVRERGNAAAMARRLQVHPQTARYRVARLRELLGDDLDDPDARFELEAALRGRV
jgi:DNA-binding PucR family transcriptional regulator